MCTHPETRSQNSNDHIFTFYYDQMVNKKEDKQNNESIFLNDGWWIGELWDLWDLDDDDVPCG